MVLCYRTPKLVKKVLGLYHLNKNIKFPHIGKVIIGDLVDSSGCTIDRGSVDNTVIGKILI